MATPKVSVIIPAYNCAHYIPRALKSVFSQDYNKLEVIVVDDGSQDDVKGSLKDYQTDSRLIYIKTDNRGVSHALNTGIGSATGDYVSFLHADDVFLPGKLKAQVLSMEKMPEYEASYTGENYFLDGTSCSIKSPYAHFSGEILYFLKKNNFIHASTVMFRKNVFELAVFDESLVCHEDWDLFLRLSSKGMKFLYIDEALSDICIHHKSLSSDKSVMDSTRNIVGLRAKELWRIFKETNIKGYMKAKMHAFMIGFPWRKRYNPNSPLEALSTMLNGKNSG